MNINEKFRFFLVLSIVCLTVSALLREVYDAANSALEAFTVAITGILLVTGVYVHGVDEGIRLEKEKQKATCD